MNWFFSFYFNSFVVWFPFERAQSYHIWKEYLIPLYHGWEWGSWFVLNRKGIQIFIIDDIISVLKRDFHAHYDYVIMGAIVCHITSLTLVYSTVYSGTDQSKHQSSASLAFVWGSHRGPVNSPHKWPVTRKMLPFDDIIMGNSMTKQHEVIRVISHERLGVSNNWQLSACSTLGLTSTETCKFHITGT